MAVRQLRLELDIDSGGFSAKVRDANGRLQSLSNSSDRAGDAIRRMERRITGATAQVRDFAIILGQAQQAINTLRFIMLDWMSAIVRSNAELERMTFLIRGMSSAADEAGAIRETAETFEYLMETARTAPFSIGQITDTFVKMRASGLDPADGSMRSLLDAVAAFGGSEQTLHRATIAIQQMAGKGVISMEELRQQLGEAIPTAVPLLARALNTTYAELVDVIEEGRLSADVALRALFQEFEMTFGGASQQMMRTFSGQVALVQTNLRDFALEIGGFDRELSIFTETGMMGQATAGLSEFAAMLQTPAARQFAAQLGATITSVGTSIRDFVIRLYEMREVLGVVAKGIALLLGIRLVIGIVSSLGRAFMTVRQTMIGYSNSIQQTIRGVQASGRAHAAHRDALVSTLAAQRASAAAMANTSRARMVETQATIQQVQNSLRLARAEHAAAQSNVQLYQGMQRSVGYASNLTNAKRRLADATATKIRLERLERRLMAELTTASNALTMSEARRVTVTNRLNTVLAATSMRARLAAGAMGLFRGVIGALGGPIGVAITLITTLGFAFLNLESKADRARQAMEDFANFGVVNEEAVDNVDQRIAQLEELQRVARTTLALNNNGRRPLFANERASLQREIDARQQQIDTLARQREAMGEALSDNTAGNAAARAMAETRRRIHTELREVRTQLAAADAEMRDAIQNAEGSDEEIMEAQNAAAERRAQIAREITQRQITIYEEELANALEGIDQLTGQDLANRQAIVDEYQNQLATLTEALTTGDFTQFTLDDATINNAEDSPAVRTLRSMQEEAAELRAELEGAGDAGAEMAARIREGLIEGVLPDTDQAREYIRLAREAQNLREQIEAREESANTLERMQTEAARARVEAQELMRVLQEGGTEADLGLARARQRLLEIVGDLENASPEARRLFDEAMSAERLSAAAQGLLEVSESTERIEESLLDADERAELLFSRRMADIQRFRNEWVALGGTIEQIAPIIDRATAAAERDFERATQGPVDELLESWLDVTKQMEEAQAGWLRDFMDGLAAGELRMDQFVAQILADILKIQMQAKLGAAINTVLDFTMNALGGWVNGMMGGAGRTPAVTGFEGGTLGSRNRFSLPGNHGGGIAGSEATFHRGIGFPMFHNGGIVGLRDNEVMAVLEEGEGVFTQGQMRALGSALGSPAAPNIALNLINESGTPMKHEQKGARFDGENYIVDVVLKNMNRPGPMRDAMRGMK